MKKIKSGVWFLNYYKYCGGYLNLARIGLMELKDKKYCDKFNAFEKDEIYTDKELLIPIVWCIKHAIELLFKALSSRITKESYLTHENPELHEVIKQAFSSLKITDTKPLEELISLSDKYYKLRFWNSSAILISEISDNQNDVFRYPESKIGFNLGIDKLHEVTNDEETELENDIKRLGKLLLKLHSHITSAKIREDKK